MRRPTHARAFLGVGVAGLAMALLGGSVTQASAQQPDSPVRHPLDPLTADEYVQAVQLLRAAGHVNDATRFASIELRDPDKASVLAWRPGGEFGRAAFAIVKQGAQTFEAVIDLSNASVASWREIAGVQPGLLVEEMVSVVEILAANDAFVAALTARGFSIDQLFCAPFTSGNYDIPAHRGRRLIKTSCFVVGDVSPFNRPIEGLWAVVDINTREVAEMVDEAVIPVSGAPAAIDGASIASQRAQLEPVLLHQPNGSNFTIRGHVLEWDNWTLHYRMEKRSGLVVSTVSYRDGDRQRRVLYQGALSEIFVPYMDPNGNWFSRTFMDVGEYGFGANATPLAPGVDCPDTGVRLDALVPDDMGVAVAVPDAICIFERNAGDPAWRHFDNILGTGFEGRRAVELVLRMIATLGNYDYYLDWAFTQDGRIRTRIGASGYDGLKGVRAQSMNDPSASAETAYGTLVAPGLVATNHDHFFSMRLDVDVDGSDNSLSVDQLTRRDFEGPRSGWMLEPRVPRTEREAQLDYDPSRPAHWRIVNPNATGPLGHAPGYVLRPENSVAHSMLNAGDMAQQRAGFIRHQLWVTPQSADERYAAGLYVNQSKGGLGLPAWTAANRPIENTDIVLWYTAGFHHVPRTEDFPIMASAWHEFQLVPFNFFDRNPALDIPTEWRGVARTGGR
ncbi:MAG: tyramine oxidase [Longimicrobiales bacterium]